MDGTGRHLGDSPQACTRLGLVSAALSLDEALARNPR